MLDSLLACPHCRQSKRPGDPTSRTDFVAFVDGVSVNIRSQDHGQAFAET